MIPECVNCKNLFTCTIKDKPKGEVCVMFEERDKDKSEARKRIDCHCWNDYPNKMHRYRGQKPYKSGKWKCVDCYEYVGKSKFGATHCKKKVTN